MAVLGPEGWPKGFDGALVWLKGLEFEDAAVWLKGFEGADEGCPKDVVVDGIEGWPNAFKGASEGLPKAAVGSGAVG